MAKMNKKTLKCPYCEGELEGWGNDWHCLVCDKVFNKCLFHSMCPSSWTTTAMNDVKIRYERFRG